MRYNRPPLGVRALSRLACAALVAAGSVLVPATLPAAAHGADARAAAPPWQLVPVAQPPGQPSLLRGVSAVTPNYGWAVGSFGNEWADPKSQSVRWNGAAWQYVNTHLPGMTSSVLNDVDALPSGDTWAVGRVRWNNGPRRTLVMRTNAYGNWATVQTPTVGVESELLGVDMYSSSNGWAVGYSRPTSGGATQNLILRWNGTAWAATWAPSVPGVNRLTGVYADGPNSAWAVGYASRNGQARGEETVILRWTGSGWWRMPSPNPSQGPVGAVINELRSVVVLSPGDAWAVGHTSSGGYPQRRPLALHWNGQSWTEVPMAVADAQALEFTDVAALSRDEVYLVGYRGRIRDNDFVMRWNGAALVRETVDLPPNFGPDDGVVSALNSVTAVAPGYLWAVGHVRNLQNHVLQRLP